MKEAPRSEARVRVQREMRLRGGQRPSGLPLKLQDRVFEPKEVAKAAPLMACKLQRAFQALAAILATQAYAFADAALSTLSRRQVDEAMNGIDFNVEQRKVLEARHQELSGLAREVAVLVLATRSVGCVEVDERLNSVKRCLSALRSVR